MAGDTDDVALDATVQSDRGVASAETLASDADVASAETIASTAAVASAETLASGGAPVGQSADTRDLPEVAESRYAIDSEVGRGGLGRVLRARDQVLDRPVALKQLFASDDASRRRFIREALITARLQHPAIIPVYDAGRRSDRSPFYAMKLVAGRPLDQAIAAATTPAARLALLPTVLAVADAVAYAHSQRIIHRDLKPGNVLVGEFGETIVIDWGLAKDLSIDDRDALPAGPYRSASADHTVVGAVLGTPGYMAPEQAAGRDVDERADVYALGAILYHVVSGAIPHEGTTLDEVIDRAIAAAVKPLAERAPETPPDLIAIVDKAMAKDPAARYPSARELADDLRRYQTGQLVGAHHYTLAQRVRRWMRRHRAITAVVAGAVVLLATLGAWSLHRVMSERDRADRERDEAVTNANRAILTQARVLVERDPASALAWLARLSPDGNRVDWSAARTIAADALGRPLPEVLLHGTREAVASADGSYAIGISGSGVWVARLVAGDTPVIVPVTFGASDVPVIEMCDDNRRGLVLTNDGDPSAEIVEVDLAARTATKTKYDDERWWALLDRCRATYRLESRAERGRRPGVRWRDPATGEDRLLAGLSTYGAWLAPDGKHAVVIDSDGAFHRIDVATGADETLIDAFQIGTDDKQPARAAMSNDGVVVVAIVQGAITYCDFTDKFCAPLQGKALPGERTIAVAPDGSWAKGRTEDRSWQIRRHIPMPGSADLPRGDLYASADSKWLLALHEGTLTAQDVTSHTTRVVGGHERITGLRALPHGRVFTVGSEGTVRVSSLGTASTPHGMLNSWMSVISPGVKWLVADGLEDNMLLRRDLARNHDEKIPGYEMRERAQLAINDDGVVARVARDGTVYRYEASGNWRKLGVHGERVDDIRVLRGGNVVTLGRTSLAVWEPAGPRFIKLPAERRDYGYAAMQLDRAERRALVSCGEPRCIVDVASGRIDVLADSVGRGLMSEDGKVALTGGPNNQHLVWDLDALRVTNRLGAMNATFGALGISRDGRRAVIKTEIGVELIDLASGERTPLRSKVPLSIGWMLFSPDGRSIIDNTTMLWDVASGEGRLVAPQVHSTAVDLLDDKIIFATEGSFDIIPDDLPREPRELARHLDALPYHLDAKDTLFVR